VLHLLNTVQRAMQDSGVQTRDSGAQEFFRAHVIISAAECHYSAVWSYSLKSLRWRQTLLAQLHVVFENKEML
jgi:hypothetical protein